MITNRKDAIAARQSLQETASLPDWYIREKVKPKPPSDWERRQAAISAQMVEDDRKEFKS